MIKDRANSGLTSPNNPNNLSGGDVPEGVSFDGSTDYLSRSTDLVGNVDSKTFTFSCWVYSGTTSTNYIYANSVGGTTPRFIMYINSGNLYMTARTISNAIIFDMVVSSGAAIATYSNVLVSIDLENIGNRYVYVNDKLASVTWNTYINDTIDFTGDKVNIASNHIGGSKVKGRLSHLFLDYTYRDLSIEANRRAFITADGKPADGLESVGGTIRFGSDLYIPIQSEVSKGGDENSGILYSLGSYNRISRFNVSTGAALSNINITSSGDSNVGGLATDGVYFYVLAGSTKKVLKYNLAGGAHIDSWDILTNARDITTDGTEVYVSFYDAGFIIPINVYSIDGTYLRTFTAQTGNTSSTIAFFNNYLYINDGYNISRYTSTGVRDTSYSTKVYSSSVSLHYSSYYGTLKGMASVFNGSSFDLYARTIDLTDGEAYAKSLEQPILYLPMKDAATAHQNLGTGGNFVQNGLLMTADRGANQDNCVASYFDGVDDYLSRTSLTGVTDGKQCTLSFTLKLKAQPATNKALFAISYSDARFAVMTGGTVWSGLKIFYYTSSGTIRQVVNITSGFFIVDKAMSITISIDTSQSTLKLYVDGKLYNIYSTVLNDIIDFTSSLYTINSYAPSTSSTMSEIGELYFDTKYIDLATNNPFWDSETGRPNSVRKVMRDIGSNPLIALPISADNPGKNYGTGGDFTLFG